MSILQAIVLGLTEGLTEFLPVSSSGHLIIVRWLFGWGDVGGLSFDAIIQLASALAVIIYFWRDLWAMLIGVVRYFKKDERGSEPAHMVLSLIIATIPAVILGLLLEKTMDTLFRNVALVALALIAGSAVIVYAERVASRIQSTNAIPDWRRALTIGLFQCLAIVPGMSRSGMTIAGGLYTGFNRELATKYSFYLMIPLLVGGGLKKMLDVVKTGALGSIGIEILIGSIVSFVTSIVVIHYFLKYVRTHSLKPFIWWRLTEAGLILIGVAVVYFTTMTFT